MVQFATCAEIPNAINDARLLAIFNHSQLVRERLSLELPIHSVEALRAALATRTPLSDALQLEQTKFHIQLLDAKQSAIKVYMNTFYGEAGNKKSPFFDLVVAGGTTALGQKYIRMVHQMVATQDCEIVYGDTDSIYMRPRFSHYRAHDTNTALNTYALIERAIQVAHSIRDQVNHQVGLLTDGKLKMEFEEVLCPSLFMGKKKYCGVKHKEVSLMPNIHLKDVLIKGIDFIKSQYPQLVKDSGYALLTDVMQMFAKYDQVHDEAHLQRIFADDYRAVMNEALQQVIVQSVDNFANATHQLMHEVQGLAPHEARSRLQLLATKKKLRDSKNGGEMKLFYARFKDLTRVKRAIQQFMRGPCSKDAMDELLAIDMQDLQYAIDTSSMQRHGIEIPQIGELVDIVYVESTSPKISDRMHLLDYVAIASHTQPDLFSIDRLAYVDMYLTSAKRLYVCTVQDCVERVNRVGRELSDEEVEQQLVDKCGPLIVERLSPQNRLIYKSEHRSDTLLAVREEYAIALSRIKLILDLPEPDLHAFVQLHNIATVANRIPRKNSLFIKDLLQYIHLDESRVHLLLEHALTNQPLLNYYIFLIKAKSWIHAAAANAEWSAMHPPGQQCAKEDAQCIMCVC